MSKYDEAMSEIAILKKQIQSDFEFNALAMREMSDRTRQTFDHLHQLGGEISERFHQVEGHTRLLESRFTQMLRAVETSLTETRDHATPVEQVQALEKRVERLEQARWPAA
jgi:hypothetical protein